eukprot:TRINITY_DN3393_c3_g1_i6.p1 TRINITY_DN3393_c3_g1~~TRINITY_DN3393_c3_g1_i6.p1  ORF type:complete len:276 (+),score=62.31 TRINITY_DN3393_c3_g1_i6:820-1647(+)
MRESRVDWPGNYNILPHTHTHSLSLSLDMYPLEFMVSGSFSRMSIVSKLIYMNASITLARFKYYFGWGLAEGACTLAGLGYNGTDKNGNHKWDKLQQVNVLGVELGQSFKDLTDGWNMNTSKWLRYYVYERIPGNGFHNVALTHLTSAFWHGFYPGYYLFFMHMSLAITTGRRMYCTLSLSLSNSLFPLAHNLVFLPSLSLSLSLSLALSVVVRRHLRPYWMIDPKTGNYPLKYLYDFMSWVATLNTINFFGCAFLVRLSLSPSPHSLSLTSPSA